MSVDTIITRIREEADKEIRIIRSEETCDISHIRTQAEQKAEEAYNHRMAEGHREIRQYIASEQSRARIEAKRLVRKTREDIINECFKEVSVHLKEIRKKDEYPALFENLIRECVQNLGKSDILVQVHSDDRSLAETVMKKVNSEGFSIRISDDSIDTNGGVICIRISDNVSIDNTFETRVTRMEREMISIASQILFQNGES